MRANVTDILDTFTVKFLISYIQILTLVYTYLKNVWPFSTVLYIHRDLHCIFAVVTL